MGCALLSAQRSKDPNTQVGACLVDKENKILSIGYNGFPNGCSDDVFPWVKEADSILKTKYPFVCHAEMNAIVNKNSTNLKGAILYTTLFPCNECCKIIIQSGIQKIIYLNDKYKDTEMNIAAKLMLNAANIPFEKLQKEKTIILNFE